MWHSQNHAGACVVSYAITFLHATPKLSRPLECGSYCPEERVNRGVARMTTPLAGVERKRMPKSPRGALI